ncbi:NADP-reducing hydrogenase subunit HndB [Oxobacter pfennigii]|uniref:NADP-reducing hydrogenase subunit HndB n=1 Tax=Oxobacter pfennigii TaxID=36849 RepID=A0A0N8NT79_9CLOT|nr:(2Fe-2S) ferredoxin domain-containing protein [Oxobacter pfennigii]KPU44080.1 NADP-reducing hydrogenase subunit HndB [Oxobacter pfennigii]
MKTIQELEEIRKRTFETIKVRREHSGTRIVVAMGTCGIKAGARDVMVSIMETVAEDNLTDVVIAQTGCTGNCDMEPIVEVYRPGQDKVTYVKMTPEKVAKIVKEHLAKGKVVSEYTMNS